MRSGFPKGFKKGKKGVLGVGNNFHKTTPLNKHLNKHLLNRERNLPKYLEILNAF